MTTYLSKEIQESLDNTRRIDRCKKPRHRVIFNGNTYPLIELWDNGFSLEAKDAPRMRGLVDIFDGSKHVSRCLVFATDEEDGRVNFEFKRRTQAKDQVPLDFERKISVPVALLN